MRNSAVSAISLLLLAFSGAAWPDSGELSEASYAAEGTTKGVVLFDADIGRYGSCGGYETAQLRRIAFARMPLKDMKGDSDSDAEITGPFIPTAAARGLRNYAFLLSPGEYAMTHISIRVTRSASDVGHIELGPDKLVPEGVPKAGTFRIAAGEVVYIGNFKIDCAPPMTLWRYYTPGKGNFASQVAEYGRSFPFLKLDDVKYRLFETKTIGAPYELK